MAKEDEGEDLEFLTKEEIDEIDKDPRLKKLRASMTTGVQKKFQGYNTTTKQLQQQLTDLSGALDEWEQYGKVVDPIYRKSLESSGGEEEEEQVVQRKVKNKDQADAAEWKKAHTELTKQFNEAATFFKSEMGKMGQMVKLTMQSVKILKDHPDADLGKLLDHALKSGKADLEDAYTGAYHKEIVDKEVNTQVESRLKEELAKKKTKVESGSGETETHFEIPKLSEKDGKVDGSKNWGDLSHDFLKERAEAAESGGTPGTGSK
jgi:hypothetical protein